MLNRPPFTEKLGLFTGAILLFSVVKVFAQTLDSTHAAAVNDQVDSAWQSQSASRHSQNGLATFNSGSGKNAAHPGQVMDSELYNWILHFPPVYERLNFVQEVRGTSHDLPNRQDIPLFIRNILLPVKSKYFELAEAVDHRLSFAAGGTNKEYDVTAPELALFVPLATRIVRHESETINSDAGTAKIATQRLLTVLRILRKFRRDFPEYHGFFPRMKIDKKGNMIPFDKTVSVAENVELTWSVAAAAAVMDHPQSGEEREIKNLADQILAFQDYNLLFERQPGPRHDVAWVVDGKGGWEAVQARAMDACSDSLAVMWASLHGLIPEYAWTKLKLPDVHDCVDNVKA